MLTGNSQSMSYQIQRANRKFPNLKKIKPNIEKNYPGNHNSYIFDNPIFENYFTQYMEETQHDINEVIDFDQFKTIFWKHGVPQFIIDVLSYITGLEEKFMSALRRRCPCSNKYNSLKCTNIIINTTQTPTKKKTLKMRLTPKDQKWMRDLKKRRRA